MHMNPIELTVILQGLSPHPFAPTGGSGGWFPSDPVWGQLAVDALAALPF
jgi:hypothetical protein